jgi:2-hydroxy-3-keto-5-methylthiopentenyl-1-phosphate phosphatase
MSVISNPGIYANRGIKLMRDHTSPFFSATYGIDKALVIKDMKAKYQTVYYAGDSGPDLEAAILADTAFAKGKLQALLERRRHPYVPFESFAQIENYLTDKRMIMNAESAFPPYSDSEYPESRQRYPAPDRRINEKNRF